MSSPPTVHPQDAHNNKLVANVHPPGWKNPVPEGRYNLVVIGAGSAGLISSLVAAGLGAKTALVERHLMGGDCLNVGCVPSKALIRSARCVHDAAHGEAFGLAGGSSQAPDFAAAMERMREIRARISHEDSAARYRDEFGVDVYLGDAHFTGPRSVQVGDTRLDFARAAICTGGRPADPGVPGLAEIGYLDNESVFTLTRPPGRLAVIGAGPIGCELAQAFQRLGCEVTLLQRASRILPREDPDAAEVVRRALERDGVRIITDCVVEGATRENGHKRLRLRIGGEREAQQHAGGKTGSGAGAGNGATGASNGAGAGNAAGGGKTGNGADNAAGAGTGLAANAATGAGAPSMQTLEVDEVLAGAGRVPNIEGLGLSAAGVAANPRAGIRVDDFLRTSNPRIYAAGDCCMRWKFTHAADAAAKILVQNALFAVGPFGRRRLSGLVMPWCTYTDPEIAHVGLYEAEAVAQGKAVETYQAPIASANRAVTDGEEAGLVKVLVKKGSDRILGATIVASHAGELITQLTLALSQGIGLGSFTNLVYPYPTVGEAVKRAAGAYTRTRLTPTVAALFAGLMKLRRGGRRSPKEQGT